MISVDGIVVDVQSLSMYVSGIDRRFITKPTNAVFQGKKLLRVL